MTTKSAGIVLIALSLLFCMPLLSAEEQLIISASPETGESPLTVLFSANTGISANSESSPLDSYAWDFANDGTIDSTDANPSFTYTEEGTYTVALTAASKEIAHTATTEITVVTPVSPQTPITLSLTATPTTGQVPFTVQFVVAAAGSSTKTTEKKSAEAFTYSWDFNNDGKADSTLQNPQFTYTSPGTYTPTVTVRDGEGNTASSSSTLAVEKYDSHLNLTSFFPDTLHVGENSITFIIINQGQEPVSDISAKIIGEGIQHLTSTTIPFLNPNDQDSLTLRANLLEEGELSATVKILDKNFPLLLTISKGVTYDSEKLQGKLDVLKETFEKQESIYFEKKSENYQVAEVAESIKSVQQQLREIQQNLLTNKLPEASVGLQITGAAISDISSDLTKVKQQEVTVLLWLKENAVAITAIIAAMGTLGGVLVKVKYHAQKVTAQAQKLGEKLGEDVKKKFEARKHNPPTTRNDGSATNSPELKTLPEGQNENRTLTEKVSSQQPSLEPEHSSSDEQKEPGT